jgi:hypothetical protein
MDRSISIIYLSWLPPEVSHGNLHLAKDSGSSIKFIWGREPLYPVPPTTSLVMDDIGY